MSVRGSGTSTKQVWSTVRPLKTSAQAKLNAKLRYEYAMKVLGHPGKDNGGEDAAFICSEADMVGVSDGVGGWAERGIDSGAYARSLMEYAHLAALDMVEKKRSIKDPLDALVRAHKQARDLGSATACILAFDGTTLRAANIGDSGFAIVRRNKLCFKSPSQQHSFNFPYQIGRERGNDSPMLADKFEIELREGDIVVLATDGLFDNVFDDDLCRLTTDARDNGQSAQEVATMLATHAQECGKRTKTRSPFSEGAASAGYTFMGGKLDDTSVVVTYVLDGRGNQSGESIDNNQDAAKRRLKSHL